MRTRSLAQASMESTWIARIYESRLWRRNPLIGLMQGISFDREFALVEGALRVNEDDRVLDLGCGPGIYARPLAARTRPRLVVGVDLSPAMLATAAAHPALASLENLTFVRADAQQLPIAPGLATAASCCGALHLFSNPDAALVELHRVLAPGGRLAISAYRRRSGALAERAAAMRLARTGLHAFLPEDLESRLHAAGFTNVQCLHARGTWLVMSAAREANVGS